MYDDMKKLKKFKDIDGIDKQPKYKSKKKKVYKKYEIGKEYTFSVWNTEINGMSFFQFLKDYFKDYYLFGKIAVKITSIEVNKVGRSTLIGELVHYEPNDLFGVKFPGTETYKVNSKIKGFIVKVKG